MTESFIKIIIADDHELFRDGFRVLVTQMPEARLIGEAENGEELVRLTEILQPDLVILDMAMPRMDGVQAAKKITAAFPDVKIIALSEYDDESSILDMIEAGAKAYLMKNAHKAEFMQAIKDVYSGNSYYCHHTIVKLARMISVNMYHPHRKTLKTDFTKREIEIIDLIGHGLASKEIAGKLQLTPRTVESYREKIMEKMEVNNTAELIVYAIKHRLYKPQ